MKFMLAALLLAAPAFADCCRIDRFQARLRAEDRQERLESARIARETSRLIRQTRVPAEARAARQERVSALRIQRQANLIDRQAAREIRQARLHAERPVRSTYRPRRARFM